MEITSRWLEISALLAIIGLIVIVGYVLSPLFDGLVLGMVLAYVGRPLKEWMQKKGLKAWLASGITTILIVMPVLSILLFGSYELINALIYLLEEGGVIQGIITSITTSFSLPDWFPLPVVEVTQLISTTANSSLSLLLNADTLKYAWDFVLLILNFLIAIVACYFMLEDGHKVIPALIKMVPEKYDEVVNRYLTRLDEIMSGIFVGSLYTATVVAILSTVVFIFFKTPYPLALAAMMFLAAMIPLFSGAMILVPVALYKYFVIGPIEAIVFLGVSVVIIYAPTELLIRPYIVSLKSSLHPFLLMLSFIGGGLMGGIGGFFLAPVAVGAICAAYDVYVKQSVSPDKYPESQ